MSETEGRSPEEEIKNWQSYLKAFSYKEGWTFGFVYDFELDHRYVTVKVVDQGVPYSKKQRVDNFSSYGSDRAQDILYTLINYIETEARNDNICVNGHYPYTANEEKNAEAQPDANRVADRADGDQA